MDRIGERINIIIKEKGINQSILAKKLGVTSSAINTICAGKSKPSGSTITALCNLYNINETWLRTGDGDMYAPITRSQEIARIVANLNAAEDPLILKLAELITELDAGQIRMIKDMVKKLADAVDNENAGE